VAWIIIQIGEATFDALNLPEWSLTMVIVLLLLGFPIAMVLAWAFYTTPQGIVKTPPSSEEQAETVLLSTAATNQLSHILKQKRSIFAVAGVGIGLALGWFLTQQFSNPVEKIPINYSGERIPVAVADFVNETDEKALNGLSGMLITSLEQSQHLSVLTRSRMFDLLKQMGKSEVEIVDEQIGRDICHQADVNALVLTSIRKFGELYTIDLKILNPEKNEYLLTTKVEGKGQESIPGLIDELSEKTRIGLQEKAGEVTNNGTGIASVTTTNLEAYQHYFKGEEYYNHLKFSQATEALRKAVLLDSTFSIASFKLAQSLAWKGYPESSEHLKRALRHREKSPRKERLLMEAWSADNKKEVQLLEAFLTEFPEEKEALFRVGDIIYHRGRFEEAIVYLDKVLFIDPFSERALQHICWSFMALEDYENMKEYSQGYVDRVPSEWGYRLLGISYFLAGDKKNGLKTFEDGLNFIPESHVMKEEIAFSYFYDEKFKEGAEYFKQWAVSETNPQLKSVALYGLMQAKVYQGKYEEAILITDQIIQIGADASGGLLEGVGEARAVKAFWILQRNSNDGKLAAMEAEENEGGLMYFNVMFDINLHLNEWDKALDIHSKHLLTSDYADDYVIGKKEASIGNYKKAISLLEEASSKGRVFDRVARWYDLGILYLADGQYDRAISIADKIQSYNWSWHYTHKSQSYPRSFYLEGMALEAQGDVNSARENYEHLLFLWASADEGIPELEDTRKRLAKIMRVQG
jgi:tetratricopeptide (TPR) repeat protein